MEIDQELLKMILEETFDTPAETGINKKSLPVFAELIRLFLEEAIQRSVDVAEDEDQVEVEHLERVLFQLLMDFK